MADLAPVAREVVVERLGGREVVAEAGAAEASSGTLARRTAGML